MSFYQAINSDEEAQLFAELDDLMEAQVYIKLTII